MRWTWLVLAVAPALGIGVRALFRGRRSRVFERPHASGRAVVRSWVANVVAAVAASSFFTFVVAIVNEARPDYFDELVIAWLAGLVVILWRSFRMALLVTEHDVTVRNLSWSWRLPWDEIEEIFWGTPLPLRVAQGRGYHFLGFRTRGKRLAIFATASQGVRRFNWSPLDATVPRELERQAERRGIRCGDLDREVASAWDL